MDDSKIKEFRQNLDAMKPVKDVLFQKRNASVFDKLCVKLNNLFNSFCNEVKIPSKQAIEFLYDLKDFSIEMMNYRDYLVLLSQSNDGLSLNPVENQQNIADSAKNETIEFAQKQRKLEFDNVKPGSAA